jgi:uncharacterized membrane protein
MKFSPRAEWPFWTLIAAMFIASAVVWPMVPERFPMHYNLHGHVDRYGTRADAPIPLLLAPVISAVLYVLMLLTPLVDPGRANYDRFGAAYWVVRFVVLANLAVLHAVVLLSTLGHRVDIGRIMLCSLAVVLFALGTVMGKIRPNWFVGVRTPWTLSSKLSWTHTHRASGWIFIVLGFWTFAAAFLRAPWNLVAVFAGVLLGTAGLVLYSYLVWRRDPGRVPPAGTTPAENESAKE